MEHLAKKSKTLQEGMTCYLILTGKGHSNYQIIKGFELVTIFILPPSKTVLEKRLNNRAQDSKIEVKKECLKQAMK